jgi:tryptophan synthase alpha chain
MSVIESRFAAVNEAGDGALIAFTVAGHPSPEASLDVMRAVADAGADILEVGIPFSDPLGDGPVIQAASQQALAQQVTPSQVLDLVARLRHDRDIPLVIMTCFNPICQYGIGQFAARAAAAGVNGVIVTDLPPEEAGDWVSAAREHGLDTIFLLAPNTAAARAKKVVDIASGFVYCVSRMGVTGARAELAADLADLVARIRGETAKPIAVGFGISQPAHVAEVCRVANGAVVGSALVSLIDREKSSAGLLDSVRRFVGDLKEATRNRGAAGSDTH